MRLNKALSVFEIDNLYGETKSSLKAIYHEKAKDKHPDKNGGSNQAFVELREAYIALLTELELRGEAFYNAKNNPKKNNHNPKSPKTEKVSTSINEKLVKPINESSIETEPVIIATPEKTLKATKYPKKREIQILQGRDLQELSKEEIIDRYLNDTGQLKTQLVQYSDSFENQHKVLNDLQSQVSEVVSKFSKKNLALQAKAEAKLIELERQLKPSLWRRLFFLPAPGQKEFWEKYQFYMQQFSREYTDNDLEFFEELLNLYGESLNNISTITSKTS